MTLPFKMSNDLRTLKAQLQAVINDYDSYDIKFNQNIHITETSRILVIVFRLMS